jgi:homoserine O-acetyltransferase/O-succinyltransferase
MIGLNEKINIAPWDENNSVGIVKTRYFDFDDACAAKDLTCGCSIEKMTIAYETYGQLNKDSSNAVLLCHALSGDAHAAGYNSPDDPKPGWWDHMIGPGKTFDTDKYFIICSNILGGCKGSTGPFSKNPKTGQPYALDFPVITISDIVAAQKELVSHLGIKKLLNVAGGSMGGMQALKWAVDFPDMTSTVVLLASCAKLSAQGIAFNAVGRKAIMSDPKWKEGRFYGGPGPDAGLALARMIAHITYLSEESLHVKFGRRLQENEQFGYSFSNEFQVESYLDHQGLSFTKRFDANSYLYITKAMDYFDMTEGGTKTLAEALSKTRSRFLVISFSSDWLYPPSESEDIVRALKMNNADVAYCNIESDHGHDSFLLPNKIQEDMISGLLDTALSNTKNTSGNNLTQVK